MKMMKLRSGKYLHCITMRSRLAKLYIRNFVADYWPNAGTPGSQIKNMYDRIANSASASAPPAQQEATIKTEPAHTNGQMNGVGVKQELKG